MMRIAKMLAAILREIFDESAYARFLAQQQVTSSVAAYSDFRQTQTLRKNAAEGRCALTCAMPSVRLEFCP
jgi:hypothetical protein